MQLYGIEKGRKVCASKAERSQTYFCQECLSALDLHAETPMLTAHFTHKKSHPLCTQDKKSIHHLLAQMKINSLVSGNEIIVENFYPEIGWCADIVWVPYKLVFIVSPYSKENEIEKALFACKKYDLIPVWLIEGKIFPKKTSSYLLKKLYSQVRYFYDFFSDGKIKFYDRIVLDSPKYIGNPVEIDLSHPIFEANAFKGFYGDIYHRMQLKTKNLDLSFSGGYKNLSIKNWISFFLDAILSKGKGP